MHIAKIKTRSPGNAPQARGNEPFPALRISFSPGKAFRSPWNATRKTFLLPPTLPPRRGIDSSFLNRYCMHIMAVCPVAHSQGSKEPCEGLRLLKTAGLRHHRRRRARAGVPGGRRGFFDNRCTRGNGGGAVPSGPPYFRGRKCGSTLKQPGLGGYRCKGSPDAALGRPLSKPPSRSPSISSLWSQQ